MPDLLYDGIKLTQKDYVSTSDSMCAKAHGIMLSKTIEGDYTFEKHIQEQKFFVGIFWSIGD